MKQQNKKAKVIEARRDKVRIDAQNLNIRGAICRLDSQNQASMFRLLNISASGFMIAAIHNIDVGQKVLLHVTHDKTYEFVGEVIWSEERENYHCLGIKVESELSVLERLYQKVLAYEAPTEKSFKKIQ